MLIAVFEIMWRLFERPAKDTDMATLLDDLRAATNELHQALHVHPLLAPLSSTEITLDEYRRSIAAFFTAYQEMERKITVSPPAASPPVLAWLQEDIAIHNVVPLAILSDAYPMIDSASKWFGYNYVKQGSTLGGQVISKNLQRSLNLTPQESNHFFAGYGAATGAKWKEFMGLLQGQPLDNAAVVAQALASFQHIKSSCDAVLARA